MPSSRIGLISISAIANDPRVRRQGDALAAAGHRVLAVGLAHHDGLSPDWPILTATAPAPTSWRASPKRAMLRALDVPLQAIRSSHAWSVYWRLNPVYRAIADIAETQDVDLWLANDWTTLPIVLDIQRRRGIPFAYDTHELAIEEYGQNLKWRLSLRPLVAEIEHAALQHARFVSCVSEGIADHIQQHYDLGNKPHVIRNAPPYQASEFRPTDEMIDVLYHGIVAPGRALEQIIESVVSWRPEFRLTIRGPSQASYLQKLRNLACQFGVEKRIYFSHPLPVTELVNGARNFDVGLFVMVGNSLQNKFVLPNKFFEYAMAGLALCVSDLPEMRHLIDRFGMGAVINEATPSAICGAINGLDRNGIDKFKVSALAAAAELSWDREAKKLVRLVDQALRLTPPRLMTH